jgi:hypothetical protein
MKILNVTPEEFSVIRQEALDCSEADFAMAMVRRFGCQPLETYKVVVRRDVPSVPWFSRQVERIETLTE